MTGQRTNIDLEHLEWTLARFGADLERWPDEDRRALEPLIRSSSDASRMVEEARALDRLVDMAPSGVEGRDLVGRIVETARTDRDHLDAQVIHLPPRRNSGRPQWQKDWTWPSAALLAASLLLGLYIGATGLVDPAHTNGFDVASAEDSIASALPGFSFEEDITLSEDFL